MNRRQEKKDYKADHKRKAKHSQNARNISKANRSPSSNARPSHSAKKPSNNKSQSSFKSNVSVAGSVAGSTLKSKSPAATKLETLPTIASVMATKPEDRLAKAKALMPAIVPFLTSYIQKKEGSRVVQLLFKWGDEGVKQSVFKTLSSHWREMIRSKYSIFVLKMLVRYTNIPDIVEHAVTMQTIKEAALVLETFVQHTATPQQIQQIKNRFRALSNSQDEKDQETMDNIVMKVIEKEYHQTTMSKFALSLAIHRQVQTERDKLIEYLIPRCLELIHDNEGLLLFFELVNYSSPKDRKTIVKTIKGDLANIMSPENKSRSFLAVMKLLNSVDDTVLTEKSLLRDIINAGHLKNIFSKDDKKPFAIFASLFSSETHNFNLVYKLEHAVRFTTSKKTYDQRMLELRTKIIADLIEVLKSKDTIEQLKDKDISKFLVGVIKYTIIENFDEQNFGYVKDLLTLFLNDTKKHIVKTEEFFQKNSLVCDNEAHRVLKYIITVYQQCNATVVNFVEKIVNQIQDLLMTELKKTVVSKSSYVLISLMEHGNSKDQIAKSVKKCGVPIEQIVGWNIYKEAK